MLSQLLQYWAPPSRVFHTLKTTVWLLSFMAELTVAEENVMSDHMTAEEKQKNSIQFLEHEIECPRCHDSMILYSDFDNLYYSCDECAFCLYTIKK
jgi:late competence protein required for DNA uptake (superfamily II DNA/RNA helicase)